MRLLLASTWALTSVSELLLLRSASSTSMLSLYRSLTFSEYNAAYLAQELLKRNKNESLHVSGAFNHHWPTADRLASFTTMLLSLRTLPAASVRVCRLCCEAVQQFGLSALPRKRGVVVQGSFVGSAGHKVGDQKRSAGIVLNFNKEARLGAKDPLGSNLGEDEDKLKDYRAMESKHGHLAMMGSVGMQRGASAWD